MMHYFRSKSERGIAIEQFLPPDHRFSAFVY